MNPEVDVDDDYIVCRCEEITYREIVNAVREGAHTVDAVKRKTRAGMGLCQGRTCSQLIINIICEELSKGKEEVLPFTPRCPFRPISTNTLVQYGALKNERDCND